MNEGNHQMNKQRREAITKLATQIGELQGEIDTLMSEEQDYYNNMPESLQGGEKGENAQATIDSLQEAYDAVDTIVDALSAASGD